MAADGGHRSLQLAFISFGKNNGDNIEGVAVVKPAEHIYAPFELIALTQTDKRNQFSKCLNTTSV